MMIGIFVILNNWMKSYTNRKDNKDRSINRIS